MSNAVFDSATGFDAVDGSNASSAGYTNHAGNTVTPPTVADIIARMWTTQGTT
jgi:hypothetical protein